MSTAFPALILVGGRTSQVSQLITRAVPMLSMQRCATAREGLAAVARGRVRLLVCEPQDARGESTESLLVTVAARFASVGIVGVVPRARVEGGALVRLVRSGTHALLLADDQLSPLDCRRVFTEALVRSGGMAAGTGMLAATLEHPQRLLEYGLRYSHAPVTVAMAAQAIGVSRKTLFIWCAEAGYPAPQQMLGWSRLLAVATLLEDEGRQVDHIAHDLEFPSGSALRNMMQRYCGLTPNELRNAGATAEVGRRYRAAIPRPRE